MSTTTKSFTVLGMTCDHCVRSVAVDFRSGLVTVEAAADVPTDAFVAAVDEAGYELVS